MKGQFFEVRIAPLSSDNIDPLTEMTLALWPECAVEEASETWTEAIGDANQFCALARIGDTYAGFIHLSIRNDYVEGSDADSTAYLEGIFVRPEYRNRGVASLLLREGEQWVKRKGLHQIASDSEIGNLDGRHFHDGAGFTEVNRIVCYIKRI
jgi:aminoglycoside 6'-N-acetyltransferase I